MTSTPENGPRRPSGEPPAVARPFVPTDAQVAEAALYAAVRDLAGLGRRAARARHVRRRRAGEGTC